MWENMGKSAFFPGKYGQTGEILHGLVQLGWGLYKVMSTVIGLGPRDARFHTLNLKNAHFSQDKCANFASIISRMVNK